MALKQNQPKPGHLRGTSTNKTNRTGRSDGAKQVQGGVPGHKYGKSAPMARKGGSEPTLPGSVRGYRDNVSRKRGAEPVRKDLVGNDGRIG